MADICYLILHWMLSFGHKKACVQVHKITLSDKIIGLKKKEKKTDPNY